MVDISVKYNKYEAIVSARTDKGKAIVSAILGSYRSVPWNKAEDLAEYGRRLGLNVEGYPPCSDGSECIDIPPLSVF